MQNEAILPSYEVWSRVIGGMLECAGIEGFLSNRNVLEQTATGEGDDPVRLLFARAWELSGEENFGAIFHVGKPEAIVGDANKQLKGRPVYSILDILNGANTAGGGEVIEIPNWGYAKIDDGIIYGSSAKSRVSQRFSQAVEQVKSVDGKPLQFEKLGSDKHSVFYGVKSVDDAELKDTEGMRKAA